MRAMRSSNTQYPQAFALFELLLGIVTIAVVMGGAWYIWTHRSKSNRQQTALSAITHNKQAVAPAPASDPYAGWKTYCDDSVKACIQHPSGWQMLGDGALENPTCTAYVSMAGPTVKDGGGGTGYIASIDNLKIPFEDLKVVGIIVDSQPMYSIYNGSYLEKYGISAGQVHEIGYANYRFNGKTGDAALDATPCTNGYAAIKNFEQAKAWFGTAEARDCLKILQSFYYE